MEGYLVINEDIGFCFNAFETKEEAEKCKFVLNNKVLNGTKFVDSSKVIKCKTSRDWNLFSVHMKDKGNKELSEKAFEECLALIKQESK